MSVRALQSIAVASATLGILVLTIASAETAGAATPPIGLGTATSYAVIAGSTITNTGPSVLTGDRGLSPGTDVTGFPPGQLIGASHTADAEALQAQNDLTTAYVDAAGRTPATSVPAELGGSTFVPGAYVGATLQLTGTMTIDAGGDPDAVFLFKTNETLITASNSAVELIGSADPCNIFWQVSSSATLGTGSDFVGTVMASTSITADAGADVVGRLLARNGAVTLDSNVITSPTCATLPPATTTTTPTTTGGSSTTTAGPTTTGGPATTGPTTGPVATTTPGSTSIPASTTSGSADSAPTTTQPADSLTSVEQNPRSTTTTTTTTPGSSTTAPGITTGTLAKTGSDLGVPVGLGLLCLGGGAGILVLRRRALTP